MKKEDLISILKVTNIPNEKIYKELKKYRSKNPFDFIKDLINNSITFKIKDNDNSIFEIVLNKKDKSVKYFRYI